MNCVKSIFERVLLYESIQLLHTLLQLKTKNKTTEISITQTLSYIPILGQGKK